MNFYLFSLEIFSPPGVSTFVFPSGFFRRGRMQCNSSGLKIFDTEVELHVLNYMGLISLSGTRCGDFLQLEEKVGNGCVSGGARRLQGADSHAPAGPMAETKGEWKGVNLFSGRSQRHRYILRPVR